MSTDTKKFLIGAASTVVTGFLLGAGFMLAKRVFTKKTPIPTKDTSSANGENEGWYSQAQSAARNDVVNNQTLYVSSMDGSPSPNDLGWAAPDNAPSRTNFDFTTGKFK